MRFQSINCVWKALLRQTGGEPFHISILFFVIREQVSGQNSFERLCFLPAFQLFFQFSVDQMV